MRMLNSEEAWKTVRAAIEGWGPTLRLIVILSTSSLTTVIVGLLIRLSI